MSHVAMASLPQRSDNRNCGGLGRTAPIAPMPFTILTASNRDGGCDYFSSSQPAQVPPRPPHCTAGVSTQSHDLQEACAGFLANLAPAAGTCPFVLTNVPGAKECPPNLFPRPSPAHAKAQRTEGPWPPSHQAPAWRQLLAKLS